MAAATSDMRKLEVAGEKWIFPKRAVIFSVSGPYLGEDGIADEESLCETSDGGGETDTEGVLTVSIVPTDEESLPGVGGGAELAEDSVPAREPSETYQYLVNVMDWVDLWDPSHAKQRLVLTRILAISYTCKQ